MSAGVTTAHMDDAATAPLGPARHPPPVIAQMKLQTAETPATIAICLYKSEGRAVEISTGFPSSIGDMF